LCPPPILLGGGVCLLMAVAILPTFAALVQVPSTFDVSPDLTVFVFVDSEEAS
jgi:hypothetical protein